MRFGTAGRGGHDGRLGPRLAPHVAIASVGYVVFALAGVPATVTTRLCVDLGSFGLAVSAALGAFVVAQPVASRLTRRHPTTRLLGWGCVGHVALAVALDLAVSFPMLVAMRAAWGLVAGFVLSVGATQIARLYAGTAATRQQGIYGGVLTLGGALAFLVGPSLVDPAVGGGVTGALHSAGAALALPAVVLSRGGAGETAPPDGARAETPTVTVVSHPVVLVAALAYVAIIGSYVTLSTFVTAYYTDLGVVGPLNAFVLVTATVGRAAGGVAVGSTSDAVVIGGGTAVAVGSFAVLAGSPPTALVVALPVVAMLAVSVPFGTTFAVTGRATDAEGTALAFVVACGNVAALVLPTVTGALYDATGSYAMGFGLLAAVNAVALVGTVALARRA
jgi:predicted MFS family arabinose efflux permease